MDNVNIFDGEKSVDFKPQIQESDSIIETLDFFIVGIGASAGGIEALEQFFTNIPTVSNMAFVVIQHLSKIF